MDPTSQTVPAPVACNNGNHHHNHGNGHNECEPVPSDDQSSGYLIKPPATMETGKVLASLLYNIQVERIKQLNGYDDCNYHLVAKGSEQEFTLKITNSLDSQNVALMQAQMDVMLYLSKQGFKVNDGNFRFSQSVLIEFFSVGSHSCCQCSQQFCALCVHRYPKQSTKCSSSSFNHFAASLRSPFAQVRSRRSSGRCSNNTKFANWMWPVHCPIHSFYGQLYKPDNP